MNNPEIISPLWDDYELIDCGAGEKLERWGRQITVRPEPQAVWRRSLPEDEWERLATAVFRREGQSEERGQWALRKGTAEQWSIAYRLNEAKTELKFRLGLTAFKHVGLFPEQSDNWEFINRAVRETGSYMGRKPHILNLFAYTGGATLAAAQAGADIVHVDSVRAVVQWASENAALTGIDGIHWIVEDATKFVEREVRRGHKYDGIILDPPAYGHGVNGEKWILERDIAPLLEGCAALLDKNGFVVLNLYSMGLSATVANTLAAQMFPPFTATQFGELVITDRFSKQLPLGVFWRGRHDFI